MSLQYVKGSYMDEVMYGDKPVLFTLEGLGEDQKEEAERYSKKIWDWIHQHHVRVLAHAPLIANFKNKKWRSDGEPEISAEEIRGYLESNHISRLYAHQVEMFEKVRAGENVVITTSTASGKTLAFLLPVLQGILEDPLTRAIFIYPTKALAPTREFLR